MHTNDTSLKLIDDFTQGFHIDSINTSAGVLNPWAATWYQAVAHWEPGLASGGRAYETPFAQAVGMHTPFHLHNGAFCLHKWNFAREPTRCLCRTIPLSPTAAPSAATTTNPQSWKDWGPLH